MTRWIRYALMALLPLVVLAIGALGAFQLISSYEAPEQRPPEIPPPSVQVEEVQPGRVQLTVKTEGTVAPRTESELVPEVSGRVTSVSQSLVVGGFFEAGDTLLTIDAKEYELAVIGARSAVAQSKLRIEIEQQEADVAIKEWETLGEGAAPDLVARVPYLNEARAALASAEAQLEKAEFDLERTVVKAPYAGRVRTKRVDVGQFVQRGAAVATLYSVDIAEVRLPIPDDELAFLDLPLVYRGAEQSGGADGRGPRVVLHSDFAGQRFSWSGRIVRTEGEIDPQTRMVHAIAQVKDPYAQGANSRRPPLAVGMFVEAEIQGRGLSNVVVLPRTVVHGDNVVWIIGDDNRLEFREVEIARRETDRVIIRSGIKLGERICVSPLESAVNGMVVRVIEKQPEQAASAD